MLTDELNGGELSHVTVAPVPLHAIVRGIFGQKEAWLSPEALPNGGRPRLACPWLSGASGQSASACAFARWQPSCCCRA